MKKVVICNVIALVLLTFSALFVQSIVESIIHVEVVSDGVSAWSHSDWLYIEVHNIRDEQIGLIRNYPVYVLAAALVMNLVFWMRHRAR